MASTFPTALDAFTNPTATSLLTSPNHAQQHSDINDAVEALEAKVAIGATVLGAWIDYTPTWTGAFINPVIGNGSIAGRYSLVNKTVTAQILITMGSTTTYGNGAYFFSLPVTAAATLSGYPALGAGWANDVSAGGATTFTAQVHNSGTTDFSLRYTVASGNGSISHNGPYVWATSDFITATIQYKAA